MKYIYYVTFLLDQNYPDPLAYLDTIDSMKDSKSEIESFQQKYLDSKWCQYACQIWKQSQWAEILFQTSQCRRSSFRDCAAITLRVKSDKLDIFEWELIFSLHWLSEGDYLHV
jgi:hypothetical protein